MEEEPWKTEEEPWELVPKKDNKDRKERKDRTDKKNKMERDGILQCGSPTWMLELRYRPPPPLQPTHHPCILLLVGLPGSGKSTLAKTLCRVLPWKYVWVNQDELGSRQACMLLTEEALEAKKCPVIDRCNISRQQRRHFTDSKQQKMRDVPVDCIVVKNAPVETCVRRCKSRQNHPTLDRRNAERVVNIMMAQWEEPVTTEGFRSVIAIADDDTLKETMQNLIEFSGN